VKGPVVILSCFHFLEHSERNHEEWTRI